MPSVPPLPPKKFNWFAPCALGVALWGVAFSALVGQKQTAPRRYPEWLGRWPAVAGLVGFIFLELVWGQTGFAALKMRQKLTHNGR